MDGGIVSAQADMSNGPGSSLAAMPGVDSDEQ